MGDLRRKIVASKLARSMLSLSILQIANYIIPLVTIPYLVRVLGAEGFGKVAFSQALALYAILLTDYGFNYSATRSVSVNRGDRTFVNTLFSNTLFAKLLIYLFGALLILVFLGAFAPVVIDDSLIYWGYMVAFGYVLFPVWLFQGIEKMEYIAVLNLISRCCYVFAIFCMVNGRADYLLVLEINALTNFFMGVGSLIICYRLGYRLELPKILLTKKLLVEGRAIFVSRLFVSMYANSTVFFLGLLSSPVVVGYYSAAEKIIRAVAGLLSPIVQSLYPNVSEKFKQNSFEAIRLVSFWFKLIAPLSILVSFTIFLLAPYISKVFLGVEFADSALYLRILSPIVTAIGVSSLAGVTVLLAKGENVLFAKILASVGFLHIVMLLVLVPLYDATGAALAVLVSEFLVAIIMALVIYNKRMLATEL